MRRSDALVALGCLLAAGLLSFAAYSSRRDETPPGRGVEVSLPGVVKGGARLFAHPYSYGAEPTGRIGEDARPVTVMRYDGRGAASVSYEGKVVDVEAADVSLRLRPNCVVPLSDFLTGRNCRRTAR